MVQGANKEQVAPPDWPGSLPEFLVYQELLRRGLREGLDFVYQSRQMGGRLYKGGAIVDFLFFNPPDLAIDVQSEFFHYRTAELRGHDELQRIALEGQGITVIYIDEFDILKNVGFFVSEALRFRDHSRMVK
jgi:hypothetical protein